MNVFLSQDVRLTTCHPHRITPGQTPPYFNTDLNLFSSVKLYPNQDVQTQSQQREISRQVEKELRNRKDSNTRAEPTDPSASIMWLLVGRRKKKGSMDSM